MTQPPISKPNDAVLGQDQITARPGAQDYPDAVVVAYLERVRALSVADRQLVDQAILRGTLLLVPWSIPSAIWRSGLMALLARSARRATLVGCESVEAHRQYELFWQMLVAQGWHAYGRMQACLGLNAVRHRSNPELAAMYDKQRISGLVSRAAIGWRD